MNAKLSSPQFERGWQVSLAICWLATLFLLSPGATAADKKVLSTARRERASGTAARPAGSGASENRRRHTLDEALQRAEKSAIALKDVKDYTAIFVKTELIKGRLTEQSMDLKLREQPFSVYLHCRSKPEAGREVYFVAGAKNGKLLVHEAGLKGIVGIVELAIDDPQVMQENRRPITQIGIANIIAIETPLWRQMRDLEPRNVEVTFEARAEVGSCPCDVIELKRLKPIANSPFSLTRVYLDEKTRYPLQVEHFGWPEAAGGEPPLVERYRYCDLKINVGLEQPDFQPNGSRNTVGKPE